MEGKLWICPKADLCFYDGNAYGECPHKKPHLNLGSCIAFRCGVSANVTCIPYVEKEVKPSSDVSDVPCGLNLGGECISEKECHMPELDCIARKPKESKGEGVEYQLQLLIEMCEENRLTPDGYMLIVNGIDNLLSQARAEGAREEFKKFHGEVCDKVNALNALKTTTRDYALGMSRVIEMLWDKRIELGKDRKGGSI